LLYHAGKPPSCEVNLKNLKENGVQEFDFVRLEGHQFIFDVTEHYHLSLDLINAKILQNHIDRYFYLKIVEQEWLNLMKKIGVLFQVNP
jgi:hypothetical protein